jgi:hypothetical protein
MDSINNPILNQINSLPLMMASIPPETLAQKAKGYATTAAIAGLVSMLKWGWKKGTLKPTKYSSPIYAITILGVGYYLLQYKKELQTVASNLQQGFQQPKIIQENLESKV